MKLTVNDILLTGRFIIQRAGTHETLFRYDGTGYCDFPFDIAFMRVLSIRKADSYVVVKAYNP